MSTLQRPRIAFAGTPAFAVPGLESLIDSDVDLVAVYTQPDRRAGRGKKLRFSDVKQCALDAGLTVRQPEHMRDAADQLIADSLDLFIVIAYGQLLTQAVLDAPTRGCVNIHASLLPRWRGAAPIARAIAAQDQQTGVCLMQMSAGLDEGPVLARVSTPITPAHTAASLHDELATLGGELLKTHLAAVLRAELAGHPQDNSQSTYAHKLSKAEATIDWQADANTIDCQVRGFNPFPVATTMCGDTVLKIWQTDRSDKGESDNDAEQVLPGTILSASRDAIRVATGTQPVNILELQRPGGRRQSAADFLNGFDLAAGTQLGQETHDK